MHSLWDLWLSAEAAHGERVAVRHRGAQWTYAEWGERVRRWAAHLRSSGVRAGDRVALLEPNTPVYLEVTFAAALVGAALVPLNTRAAPAELAGVLDDAAVGLALVHPEHAERFAAAVALLDPARQVGVRSTDALPEPAACPAADPLAPPSDPDAPAQLYYTSGTTGRSKGVVLTQANLVSHARAAVREFALESSDRWGHVAPMFHLADAWALVAVSLAGGTHLFVPRFEPEEVLSAIERDGMTLTNLVPTMATRLVAHPGAAEVDASSLRLLLTGGAPAAPALVRDLMQTFGCEYAQTYGLTETSPFLTVSLLDDELRALPPSQQLAWRCKTGRPFDGVRLEVVDAGGRPVPRDARTVGEVRAQGPSVTPGYWQRPEETAAALREGWLYTGDLAVWDERGWLSLVDRKKDVILTGGETVYSTEVEHALMEHPSVLEAAAFARPDEEWGERVCAAIVLRDGATPDEDALRATCRERLAAYKTPREFRFLDALPRTGSGKVAKRHLRS